MHFVVKNKFTDGNFLLYYKGKKILADFIGLHFLNEKDEEEASITDFFNAADGKIFDDHYLIVRNRRTGFRVYDLEKREAKSTLFLNENDMASENGYFLKDGHLYLLLGSAINRFMEFITESGEVHDDSKEPGTCVVSVYSLEDFSFKTQYTLKGEYDSIYYVPFMDRYFLVDDEGKFYEWDLKDVKEVETVHFKVEGLEYSLSRKEVYLPSSKNIRVYDERFREINKLDVVEEDFTKNVKKSEPKVPAFAAVPDFSFHQFLDDNAIFGLTFFDENTFLSVKSLNMNALYVMDVIDISTGKKLMSQNFGFNLQKIECPREKEVFFKYGSSLYLLGVEDD